MKTIINLSMLGTKITGLGVYANQIHEMAQLAKIDYSIIAQKRYGRGSSILVSAPDSIGLGDGKFAAVRRFLWSLTVDQPENSIMLSPTHHGFARAHLQVLTIHDLIPIRHPRQHPLQYLYFRFFLPAQLRRCIGLITVSETTKADLVEYYKIPPERIFVVPNRVRQERPSQELRSHKVDRPFLLVVGAKFPHKNVEEVLRMSSSWRKKYDLRIVSATGKYGSFLQDEVLRLGLESCVSITGYVSNDTLSSLYAECSALVYPSRWEGFGIPPLEALAHGTQVIASNIPVHREVLGDAAIFVRLGDADSWKESISQLEESASCRARSIAAAKTLARYSHDAVLSAFQKTIEALNQLAVESNIKRTGFTRG